MATNPLSSFFGGPISQGYNPPVEFGTDIALPVGTVVDLPATGNYQPQLSSTYSSVFALPSGQYENLIHISPAQFAPNQQVMAGTPVGTVSPIYNPVPPYNVGTFPDITSGAAIGPFFSSGPHIEVGLYGNPTDAMNAYGSSSIDPTALFSQSTPPATSTPSATSTPQPQQPFPEDPLQQWLTDHIPGLGWLTGTIPSAGSPTGSNPPVLGNQAPGNSPYSQSPSDGSSGSSGPFGIQFPNVGDQIVKSLNIPSDLGQRLSFILIAIALIVVGGLIIGGGSALKRVV